MTTPQNLLNEFVEIYVTNETEGGEYGALAHLAPTMTADEAYTVQFAGHRSVDQRSLGPSTGKKIATTNAATQEMLGLSESAYGELLRRYGNCEWWLVSATRFANGRVECELAFKLARPLQGPGVGPADVIAATEAVCPCARVSRPAHDRLAALSGGSDLYDGLAKHYVLADEGTAPAGLDLIAQTVTLHNGDEMVAEGTGKAVLGDPVGAVAWLANKMAEHERSLPARGYCVDRFHDATLTLCGWRSRLEADFAGLGKVAISITG